MAGIEEGALLNVDLDLGRLDDEQQRRSPHEIEPQQATRVNVAGRCNQYCGIKRHTARPLKGLNFFCI
jgi:hypothetical protein